jgi:succinate-semialdehyde dehydrogenase/glutarate-semialdehyde dehydrogenase
MTSLLRPEASVGCPIGFLPDTSSTRRDDRRREGVFRMASEIRIGDVWRGSRSGAAFEVLDPADDSVVGSVPACTAEDAADAVDAAIGAFPAWRRETARARAGHLRRLAELLRRDRERLALTMSAEQGKPLAEARGEVEYSASFFDVAAELAPHAGGEIVPAADPSRRILALPEPLGVAAIVTPWNFPLAMIARKVAPALAVGCTAVIKPDERTPLSAIEFMRLAEEADLPPGTVNLVTGEPAPIVEAWLGDPRVRAISFTGSTEVGRLLMRHASRHLARVSLELGGHAPFLVFADADLDRAVEAAAASKFRNAGQTCICANRFIVEASIADRFAEAFAARAGQLRCGRGRDAGTTTGPLIDDAAMEKVEEHVRDAVAHGARAICGGERTRIDGLADRFFAPTVLDRLDPSMRIWREETFGPVAAIARFETEAEAVAMANDTEYGLAAYFFTRDASRLMRVAEALEYGIVGANDALPSTAEAPFGGVKQSGFGREGGRWGLEEFTSLKYVSWKV